MRSALPTLSPSRLVPLAVLLAGCAGSAPPSTRSAALLDVVARVTEAGAPASWFAQIAPPLGASAPSAGCSRVVPPGASLPTFDAVVLTRPAATPLTWSEREGRWRTAGPHQVADPSWSVGDVLVTVGGDSLLAEGALRFGGMPRVLAAERQTEGGVRLAWDPATTDDVEIYVVGPAGELRCAAGDGEATLPWWAVPADHGEVILRSRREREAELPDGTLLRVRATIERVLPLDVPNVQAAEPPSLPGPPARPREQRRSSRPPRPIFG